MEKTDAEKLIAKYKSGNCTESELIVLRNWFNTIRLEEHSGLSSEDLERISAEMWTAIQSEKQLHPKTTRLWPRIAVAAAAAVAVMTLGVWLYYANEIASSRNTSRNDEMVVSDIAPGKNTATLTLASGEVIQLSDAKTGVIIDAAALTYSDGTSISPSLRGKRSDEATSQMLTASTPRGGQYQVVLPDGTKVWLNADSKISFPSQFSGKERRVMLVGEAYFVVVHNAKQPFRVESRGQVVEDIGTEFNISAYADEKDVKTTLVEGEAAVNGTTLKPNQQAVLTANSNIKVEQIDPESVIAWQKNLFMFDAESLESIMKRVARWYNIEVVYEDPRAGKEIFSGSVSRFSKVSSLLSKLEKTGPVKFRIEKRTVYISKKINY